MNSIYESKGFNSRNDYLKSLADEHGMSFQEVKLIADILGPDEDFDGLLIELEDRLFAKINGEV